MKIVKKQIKFDLPIDGVKVKTIDELFEHITVELVDYHKSGLLVKWLRHRDAELAEKIVQVPVSDYSDHEIMIYILECFNFEIDEQIIDALFEVPIKTKANLEEVTAQKDDVNNAVEPNDGSATTNGDMMDACYSSRRVWKELLLQNRRDKTGSENTIFNKYFEMFGKK